MSGETFTAVPIRTNGPDIEASWFNMLRLAGIALTAAVGGDAIIEETDFTITNNQSSAANVTGLLFSGATVRAARVDYCVYRNTTGGGATELAESGSLQLVYKSTAATWEMAYMGSVGDAGVTLTVTSAGQVQYTSTNITGTAGTSKMTFRATTLGV